MINHRDFGRILAQRHNQRLPVLSERKGFGLYACRNLPRDGARFEVDDLDLVYRPAAEVEELDTPAAISGDQPLKGFVLDLKNYFG